MAHLVFANTQTNASKNQKSHFFCQRTIEIKKIKYIFAGMDFFIISYQ